MLSLLTLSFVSLSLTDLSQYHCAFSCRLASVFLEEEKGRIVRLRKIKSVLASGKFMGNDRVISSVTQPSGNRTRRRRRPCPEAPHHATNGYQGHPAASNNSSPYQVDRDDVELPSLRPPYPTHPFQSTFERAGPLEAPMNGESGVETRISCGAVGDTRRGAPRHHIAPAAVASCGFARTESSKDLSPSRRESIKRSQREKSREGAAAKSDESRPDIAHAADAYGEESGNNDGVDEQQATFYSTCRSTTGQRRSGHTISSGASAIDLFDQCGLVPAAAIKMKGLVGTTDSSQESRDGANDAGTHVMNDHSSGKNVAVVKCSTGSPRTITRPPSFPGGDSNSPRDVIRFDDKRKMKHEEQVRGGVATKSKVGLTPHAQPKPSLTTGAVSRVTRHAQNQASSTEGRPDRATKAGGGRIRRGIVIAAAAAAADDEPTKIFSSNPQRITSDALPQQTKVPPSKSCRSRRRWKVDDRATTESAVRAPVVPSPRAGSLGTGDFPTSEQRLVDAKVRLHKDKDLDALKSEHGEALSILQDISCPSTAAPVASPATTRNDDEVAVGSMPDRTVGNDDTLRAHDPLSRSVTTAAMSNDAHVGLGDAAVNELSANLPRIGSREQAALRSLYRKWWMKVAAGGGLPSPRTPGPPDGSQALGIAELTMSPPRSLGADISGGSGMSLVRLAGERKYYEGGTTGDTLVERLDDAQEQADAGIHRDMDPSIGEGAGSAMLKHAEREDLAVGDAGTGGPDKTHGSELADARDDEGRKLRVEEIFKTVVDETGCQLSTATTDTEAPSPSTLRSDGTRSGTTSDTSKRYSSPSQEKPGPINFDGHKFTRKDNTRDTDRGGGKSTERFESVSRCEYVERGAKGAGDLGDTIEQEQSDMDSVSEENSITAEDEEGHQGRIYLPDGRFVSTRCDLGGYIRENGDDRGENTTVKSVTVGSEGSGSMEALQDGSIVGGEEISTDAGRDGEEDGHEDSDVFRYEDDGFED